MKPAGKDLLGLHGLGRDATISLLDEAAEMKRLHPAGAKTSTLLAGRTVCMLFFEPSTRTMKSFEAAARRLSAEVTSFVAGNSNSVSKGETLLDTALNLEALGVDVFVVRHQSSGAPHRLAGRLRSGVLNAGDGWHEHPSQALLDMFTLRERFGSLEGLKVGIVGDILHSRVARSNAWGLAACGAEVTLVAPEAWMPAEAAEAFGASIASDIDEVIGGLDAVMALRIQRERLGSDQGPTGAQYAARYQINAERISRARPECVFLHPGPMNRGVEVASDVADGPQSLVLRQVENGVYVRMAMLARCALNVRGQDGEGRGE